MTYSDLHRKKSCIESPPTWGEIVDQIKRKNFARNSMTCPDLHKSVMFTSPAPMRVDIQIYTEKSCMEPPPLRWGED